MAENIKVRWLVDNEQAKIAPKTLSSQILNEDGTLFKDSIEAAIVKTEDKLAAHSDNGEIHVTLEEKESWSNITEGYATEEYVENLYTKLNSNTVLAFYCIEDVTIVTNNISKIYPANSNVEIKFIEGDAFEIIPTSDNSILSLSAFPSALSTFYPWLEGVAQFSNILFDMNDEAMYSKWSQGNQGSYHVQSAQYTNCIFWSDNPYISDVSKRTNYTLTHTSQLPLCYSTIPDNTFKSFYLAFGVNSDPNWGNPAYRDSFAKATWATQVFSYYGARVIGIVGHDDPDFNITLPKDCRGLMFDARNIEAAGTFDAINTTNFGAKSGSWREAFGYCISLKRLYIKNLKVSLNISWSPIDYDSISYIISAAANTSSITISVSPYTYNLLSQSDFDLATSKNITIALITSNYVEDKRLSAVDNKADANHTHDDSYYTKVEVDVALDAKADANHNHDDAYDAKGSASDALATAQAYTDSAAATVKNELLNGAGEAYDTLKELGDLIDVNVDAIAALETVATNKADKEHVHGISDVTGLQDAIDNVIADIDEHTHSWNDLIDKPFYEEGGTVVKTLDPKFLPDSVAMLEYTDDTYALKSDFQNLETSLSNGDVVVKKAENAASADSADNADHAVSSDSAIKAIQDVSGNVITETYETKTDASAKLEEAKSYADSAATTVKNDLLNGAGEAYDTLKELGELIDVNQDAIAVLEAVATNKADKEHTHTVSDIVGMPLNATVGQTIVAKTINENGIPVEWEAADLGNITIDEDGNAWFGTAEEIYKIPEGLPDYTDEDEGKVLSVVDGMATWTENRGGSSSSGSEIVVSETEPTDESVIFWVQI